MKFVASCFYYPEILANSTETNGIEYPLFSYRNEYLIFQKIIKLEYEFPEKFFPKAKNLVEQLLVSVLGLFYLCFCHT